MRKNTRRRGMQKERRALNNSLMRVLPNSQAYDPQSAADLVMEAIDAYMLAAFKVYTEAQITQMKKLREGIE